MISSLGWYNHRHSALVLHNCNILTVCGPFLVPFLLVLDLALEIQCVASPQLGRGLTFLSASYRPRSNPSFTCRCDKCARRGLPTYRNYKTTTGESVYTFATNENYPFFVFLLFDRSHTIMRVLHSALPMPLVSMELATRLPSSLRTLDSDPCHGHSLFILGTILHHAPLAATPYLASNFAFPGIDSVVAHGFVELPT